MLWASSIYAFGLKGLHLGTQAKLIVLANDRERDGGRVEEKWSRFTYKD